MTDKQLIADLRNKLGPFKNYLALMRALDKLKIQAAEGSNYSAFLSGYQQPGIEEAADKERIQCEKNMAQIEYIVEQMENQQV